MHNKKNGRGAFFYDRWLASSGPQMSDIKTYSNKTKEIEIMKLLNIPCPSTAEEEHGVFKNLIIFTFFVSSLQWNFDFLSFG